MIYHGDCLEVMRRYPNNHFTNILTDPPYGLRFMGKSWDHSVPGKEFWVEALRICKPGAIMLCFGGTRTYHRLACAIEDAGWEIRDCLMWIYGSGFPKSLDITKTIDKRGGNTLYWFADFLKTELQKKGIPQYDISKHFLSKNGGITGCVSNWQNGKNVPTPEQFNKLCEILNLPFNSIHEAERDFLCKGKSGSTAIWQSNGGMGDFDITLPSSQLAKEFQGYGTALKPAYEPIIMAMKPLDGTFAQNAEKWGVAGINIDACRIPTDDNRARINKVEPGFSGGWGVKNTENNELGRWPANTLFDEQAANMLDEQSGITKSSKNKTSDNRYDPGGFCSERGFNGNRTPANSHNDSGGASRFFYCAKASTAERNSGCEELPLKEGGIKNGSGREFSRTDQYKKIMMNNNHPTVKPVKLLEYLLKLITPPKNALVLDPFAGSGSTLVAAKNLGITCEGIEISEEYCEIAKARIA